MKEKIKKALNDIDEYQIEKKIKKPDKEILILKNKKRKRVLKVYNNSKNILKEVEKTKKIEKKLKKEKEIDFAEITKTNINQNYILMKFKEGKTFEKVYVQNLRLFKDNKIITKHLKLIAKGLAKIHETTNEEYKTENLKGIPKYLQEELKKEKLVPVHGDVNLENIISSKDKITFLDPATWKNKGLTYYDLAQVIHHLKFKIPLKYLSIKALIKGNKYEKIFLKEYKKETGKKIKPKLLNTYKYYNLIKQKKLIRTNKENKKIKIFKPILLVLCDLNIQKIKRKIKKQS